MEMCNDGLMCFRYPNLKSVRELLYKRGYGKVDGKRLPLNDNALIEAKLGRQYMGVIRTLFNHSVSVDNITVYVMNLLLTPCFMS